MPFMLNSCVVAAIAAGAGAANYGTAKKKEAYATYRTAADKNNTEREMHGLKAVHVMTYDDWRK